MVKLFSPDENRYFTVTSEHYQVMMQRGTYRLYQVVSTNTPAPEIEQVEQVEEVEQTETFEQSDSEPNTSETVTKRPKKADEKA